MQRTMWFVILVLMALPLTGCWFPPGSPPLPTVGPVRERSGRRGVVTSELTTSTNCADVGEILIIQGTVKNEATYPLRFDGRPAFDFIIRPGDWNSANGSEPVRRWSETAEYPAIDPVLAPGETRTFEWRWPVERSYGQPGSKGMSVVQVQFWQGEIQRIGRPAGGQVVGVGVGGLPAPESTFSFVTCQKLRNR